MPLKKPVHEGSSYVVRFTAHATSKGSALIAALWVPKQGNPVPDPLEATVAAGASVELGGTVPSFASTRRLEIIVDVPDEGSGQLELLEDGVLHSEATIADDTTWKMLVEVKL